MTKSFENVIQGGSGRSPTGISVNMLNSDFIVSKFKIQLDYCIHFRLIPLEKVKKTLSS